MCQAMQTTSFTQNLSCVLCLKCSSTSLHLFASCPWPCCSSPDPRGHISATSALTGFGHFLGSFGAAGFLLPVSASQPASWLAGFLSGNTGLILHFCGLTQGLAPYTV